MSHISSVAVELLTPLQGGEKKLEFYYDLGARNVCVCNSSVGFMTYFEFIHKQTTGFEWDLTMRIANKLHVSNY